MNGHVCCILGVCCPPGSQEQVDALADEMTQAGVGNADAKKTAAWVLENFDLAPKGSIGEFKSSIAKMARAKGQNAER